MQFDWWTFALQVVNFLILVWLLQHFLYKPVRKILADRRAAVDERIAEAEKAKDTAEAERAALADARAKFDAEKEERLAALHREISAERAEALKDAKADAEKLIGEARHKIERERAEALRSLNKEIADLAADMAAKIVAGGASDDTSAIKRFKDYAANFSEEDLRTLQLGLDNEGAGIHVMTAAKLTSDEKDAWRNALREHFGKSCAVDFAVDEKILGGAELRFPHAALKLSAAGAIDLLKKAASSE